MPIRPIAIAAFVFAGSAALAQTPLSAIDWLSDSVARPAEPLRPLPPDETAVTGGATPEVITVTPLGRISADAVGLLPASVTGLPKTLWGGSTGDEIAALLGKLEGGLLPAARGLLYTLLLAELDPPGDSDPPGRLFLARIDTLLSLGAVDQAQALLERAGPGRPERFRRWFDVSLLTGTEDAACARLRGSPDLAPTLEARIFCLARRGDWDAAALTLQSGRALNELSAAQDSLLTRFLDDALVEDTPSLPPPLRPSPLEFRLYEAIGEALPVTNMPVAFANADLRSNSGWKAQLEAAERLARTGAIDENRLLGLYTDRRAAASGGVWDRVAAIQAFEDALNGTDPAATSGALIRAWKAMGAAQLHSVFARLYGPRLADLPLAGDAGALAFRIALLSPDYERAASDRAPVDAKERFLKAIARGDLGGVPATDPQSEAVAEGFRAAGPPADLATLVARGNLGEAILKAIELSTEGARGDLTKLTHAIALFRAVGLEDVARRTGLQALLLDPRG